MATLMFWYGQLLFRAAYGNALAMDPACCCGIVDGCCDPRPDDELTLSITTEIDCGCIEFLEVILTYDPLNEWWEGTGPGGVECAALGIKWRLTCSFNSDAPADSELAEKCKHYALSVVGNTSCIAMTEFPWVDGEEVYCDCDPFSATYNFELLGLSCCDESMDGSGTIVVNVDE